MASPIPGAPIGTPFGKRGSYWSCNKVNGQGIHTGVDIRAANGAQIYAPIDGVIKHRSYGSALGNHQFAISPNPGQPFAAGEVFFAHTSDRPADGTAVKIGDPIAHVGWEGNVSPKSAAGAHLHFEYHPDTKGTWSCSGCKDPQVVLNYQAGQAPPPSSSTGSKPPSGSPAPTAPDDEGSGGGGTGGASSGTQDISGLPFRFNPVIHPSLSHVIPDYDLYGTDPLNNEIGSVYTADTNYQSFRLGRIMMAKEAFSYVRNPFNERYGFRFLYNPSTVSGGTYFNGDFFVNPSMTPRLPMQQGLEVISFEIMLNRQPEVLGQSSPSDYMPEISGEELDKLREFGTRWDLEYLYRCSNGLHGTRSHVEPTGDIGALLANPCNLLLGRIQTWGALLQVSATDLVFSSNLVPVLTKVDIQFSRYLMEAGHSLSELMDKDEESTNAVPTTDPESASPPASNAPPSTNSPGGDRGDPGATGSGTWKKGMTTTNALSLVKYLNEVNAKWPGRKKYNDGTLSGNAAHWDKPGEHNPVGYVNGPKYGTIGCVHARDITTDGADANAMVNAALRDPRVWYVINKQTIWSRNHGWEARVYNGGTDHSHDHHVHISLNAPDQAIAVRNENDQGTWF
jgi:hypothetical protein